MNRKRLKREIGFAEVSQICIKHQIDLKSLTSVTGSFGKKIFLINKKLLLRVSDRSMAREEEKFRRIATLKFVPKIIHVGALERDATRLYYVLLTLLPGDDFVNAYPETTLAQQKQLGEDIAEFLDNLHERTGRYYDIGLYVPTLQDFAGTWREGHRHYWEHLKQESAALHLHSDSVGVFENAFRFLQAFSAALDGQTGPTLLHNDFHPKNILLDQGKFSGVIDWECSQFGEADFDLCHLIHWCLYPPKPNIDFRPFLRALFQSSPQCRQVPNLAERLTLYQIEHEIQQIIWHGSDAEAWRVPRLVRWMDGAVEELLREVMQ